MAENKLADLSTEFAVKILRLTDGIKGHYSLANQLERSGTSIGANIREAKYAHSKADFVAKFLSKSVMKQDIGLNCYIEQSILMSQHSKRYPRNVPHCESCSSHLVKPQRRM